MLIGCGVDAIALTEDTGYRQLVANSFDFVQPWNEFKMPEFCHSRAGADIISDFAKNTGLALRGHCLLWHYAVPFWLNSYISFEERWTLVENYFEEILSAYPHAIAWDVCNECFNDQGTPRNHLRYLLGEDYIEKAYRLANSINPKATLFYCDNQVKFPKKWDTIISYLVNLRNTGVPIHGVALQLHSNLFPNLDGETVEELIAKLISLGFIVQVPEIVVWNHKLIPYGEIRQGEIYNDLIDACKTADLIGFWAPFDRYPWTLQPESCTPGFWDEKHQPKKLYERCLVAIQNRLSNSR